VICDGATPQAVASEPKAVANVVTAARSTSRWNCSPQAAGPARNAWLAYSVLPARWTAPGGRSKVAAHHHQAVVAVQSGWEQPAGVNLAHFGHGSDAGQGGADGVGPFRLGVLDHEAGRHVPS
jgi:hypothetical protein